MYHLGVRCGSICLYGRGACLTGRMSLSVASKALNLMPHLMYQEYNVIDMREEC